MIRTFFPNAVSSVECGHQTIQNNVTQAKLFMIKLLVGSFDHDLWYLDYVVVLQQANEWME